MRRSSVGVVGMGVRLPTVSVSGDLRGKRTGYVRWPDRHEKAN